MEKIKSRVEHRPNKTAKGFTKHNDRNERLGKKRIGNPSHPDYKAFITTLIVRGTLDPLASRGSWPLAISKRINKEHPVDKGYFKEMYVISDVGKRLLKKHKT